MSKKPAHPSPSRSVKQQTLSPTAIVIITVLLLGIPTAIYFFFAQSNRTASDRNMITTASGLKYQDIVVGTGQEAKAGDTPLVNYSAWLEDGTKINDSINSGKPYEFPLGQKRVIPGWDEGVTGMRVGGKRKLIIPPDLAFGETGASQAIPPNSTLIFEVELLGIK